MIVDTNTVDKTISTERGTVRVLIHWKNVDGKSVESVTVQGTCDGMDEAVVAEWRRSMGKITTRFSAPVADPGRFVDMLLAVAGDVTVPGESDSLFRRAMEDLSEKRGELSRGTFPGATGQHGPSAEEAPPQEEERRRLRAGGGVTR